MPSGDVADAIKRLAGDGATLTLTSSCPTATGGSVLTFRQEEGADSRTLAELSVSASEALPLCRIYLSNSLIDGVRELCVDVPCPRERDAKAWHVAARKSRAVESAATLLLLVTLLLYVARAA